MFKAHIQKHSNQLLRHLIKCLKLTTQLKQKKTCIIIHSKLDPNTHIDEDCIKLANFNIQTKTHSSPNSHEVALKTKFKWLKNNQKCTIFHCLICHGFIIFFFMCKKLH